MKKEIEGFEDVQLLVRSFYNKVLGDQTLGHYFAYVAAHHWNTHLEILDRFWSNVIFYTGDYDGNPLETHKILHHFKALNKPAFERWLHLFNETVNELFTGDKAELVKQRALSIATIMQIKILSDTELKL
ncbi:MAG: group hemoglobin [Segetibacter sp.]|nr:group hemoglobin [Segetibacter sp.]